MMGCEHSKSFLLRLAALHSFPALPSVSPNSFHIHPHSRAGIPFSLIYIGKTPGGGVGLSLLARLALRFEGSWIARHLPLSPLFPFTLRDLGEERRVPILLTPLFPLDTSHSPVTADIYLVMLVNVIL
jgi:hypothetical protein